MLQRDRVTPAETPLLSPDVEEEDVFPSVVRLVNEDKEQVGTASPFLSQASVARLSLGLPTVFSMKSVDIY